MMDAPQFRPTGSALLTQSFLEIACQGRESSDTFILRFYDITPYN